MCVSQPPRELTLAQRSNIGTILRLHDKGVSAMGRRGDQLVEVQVILPDYDLVQCITE
jgi:DnaJ-class molecular chaperone